MKNRILYTILITLIIGFHSCSKSNEGCTDPLATNYNPDAKEDDGTCSYIPTGPRLSPLEIPQIFLQNILAPIVPIDNPQTVEGIALGRKLFYDPILSGDGTQACASCHMPEFSFNDTAKFSTGITGAIGDRHSMPLFNLAWNYSEKFFWDGRSNSLEAQALDPVTNPIEMNNTWVNAIASLQANTTYPPLFNAAFGTSTIDSLLVAKAISQFERTLISANSKFDRFLLGQESLTAQELNGFAIYQNEIDTANGGGGGDCFHCHGLPREPLWTDNDFHNNGLDVIPFPDNGLGTITGNPADNGKFKTPSLRNLAYSAPYMHDGRFQTLDEVIDHYSIGLVNSPTIDPLLKNVGVGGVQLNPQQKADLKAFLLTLSDSDFITNPDFKAP